MDPEEEPEYYPWRCPCGRINKKYATECAICYGSWQAGTRHRTEPKVYNWKAPNWEDWDETSSWASSRSGSRSATRYRQDAQTASTSAYSYHQQPVQKGHGRGKGKGKGKKGAKPGSGQNQGTPSEQVSPFQKEEGFAPWAAMDSAKFMPSSALPASPFASQMPANTISEKQEWVEHIRKAYPDPTTMPEDTKLFLEKAEQESGRTGIKSLHQATKYLGKVKKHLGEVTDQRRAHRSLWMAHLSSGIKLWESQLEDFRKHQAMLTEQAGKARTEITATSRIIQQLSSTAAGGSAPPMPTIPVEPEDTTEDVADREEEALRKQLQGVLQNCAGSLGLDLTAPKPIEITEEEGGEDGDKRPKRQRSLEPFAAPSRTS